MKQQLDKISGREVRVRPHGKKNRVENRGSLRGARKAAQRVAEALEGREEEHRSRGELQGAEAPAAREAAGALLGPESARGASQVRHRLGLFNALSLFFNLLEPRSRRIKTYFAKNAFLQACF